MENLLYYVPGFRTNKLWKKVIASIYYAMCVISLLGDFGFSLIMTTIPFILFTGISVVKHRDKSTAPILAGSMILFIVGIIMSSSSGMKAVDKTITAEAPVAVVAPVKTPKEIKKEADQAKLDIIAQAKVDAEVKKVADAQAIKDKETARLKALADKRVVDAQILADKKAADTLAQQKRVAYNTGITYNQLARNPDTYKGKKVKFSGKVIQVMESDGETQLRIAIDGNYDNILLAGYDPAIINGRILKNDQITLKGVSIGVITYDSTMGGSITIPGVKVDSFN